MVEKGTEINEVFGRAGLDFVGLCCAPLTLEDGQSLVLERGFTGMLVAP
jgi:hypothetical protein